MAGRNTTGEAAFYADKNREDNMVDRRMFGASGKCAASNSSLSPKKMALLLNRRLQIVRHCNPFFPFGSIEAKVSQMTECAALDEKKPKAPDF